VHLKTPSENLICMFAKHESSEIHNKNMRSFQFRVRLLLAEARRERETKRGRLGEKEDSEEGASSLYSLIVHTSSHYTPYNPHRTALSRPHTHMVPLQNPVPIVEMRVRNLCVHASSGCNIPPLLRRSLTPSRR
jgi:hypothetical protein